MILTTLGVTEKFKRIVLGIMLFITFTIIFASIIVSSL